MTSQNVVKRDFRAARQAQPIEIEALLQWAFASECARLEFGGAAAIASGALPGFGMEYIMLQRAKLGCRVDGGGRSEPHPDADLVAAAVAALPERFGGRQMALTVAEFAAMRKRPTAGLDLATRVEPVEWRANRHGWRGKTEQIGTEYELRRGRRVSVPVMVVPVTVINPPEKISSERRFYLQWRRALRELRDTFKLNNNMTSWDVVDALPEAAPWIKNRKNL